MRYQFVFMVRSLSLSLFPCFSLLDEKITTQKPMVLFIIIDQSYVSFTFVFSWGYCLRAFRFHVCSFAYMRTLGEIERTKQSGEHTHTRSHTDRKVQTVQMKYLHFAFPYFYHRIIMTIFSFIEFIPSFLTILCCSLLSVSFGRSAARNIKTNDV